MEKLNIHPFLTLGISQYPLKLLDKTHLKLQKHNLDYKENL
jgi:hypothetical protein